ncbi:MAG: family 20 glycosylhydrolase [Crocinitomicaceae bacterium]|nr:family 20 glycosylhydrolase [Taishania sp.]
MKVQVLVLTALLSLSNGVFAQSNIIPTPERFLSTKAAAYRFHTIAFEQENLNQEELAVMQSWAAKFTPPNSGKQATVLNISFDPFKTPQSNADFYEASFVNNKVIVRYTSNASKLYAVSSILQLIDQKNDELFITPFKIQDKAKFSWRGLHLDVARHFFNVDELKRFIDIMAFYKYNKFHWHLTDDQGWRIEIKKYPKLTEIGAFRDSTVNGHYSDVPRTYKKERYGGFYTQEQIKEVIQYAAARSVTVVPEIEMPGHARAAIAAYPELSCTKQQMPVEGLWGVFDDIFCSDEKTVNFLKDVLTEVAALFPSEYIHIGGDEAPKTRWKACEVCQNNIKKNNLKDEHELQSWFIREIDAFMTKKGKKIIGWDEILQGGLSPNATVMSWQGNEGGILAAAQGHDVIMTPVNFCYFDYYQAESRYEPLAIGGLVNLEKVYSFGVIPSEISPENRKHILGAQANLWTEYIPTYDKVEYMEYPRALAMSQNLWSLDKGSYEDFVKAIVEKQSSVLKAFKINYSQSFARPTLQPSLIENGVRLYGTSPNKKGIEISVMPNGNINTILPVYKDSVDFKRSNDALQSYTITAFENRLNTNSKTQFYKHKGLGLPIEFITQPHPSYAKNAKAMLVDGFKGIHQFSNNDWLGFNEGIVKFIVNLDKKINYKKVTVGMLTDVSSWIHLPKEMKVFASKNGKKWKEIANTKINSEATTVELGGKIKQLKFEIIPMDVIPEGFGGAGYQPFTFLDELIFE